MSDVISEIKQRGKKPDHTCRSLMMSHDYIQAGNFGKKLAE